MKKPNKRALAQRQRREREAREKLKVQIAKPKIKIEISARTSLKSNPTCSACSYLLEPERRTHTAGMCNRYPTAVFRKRDARACGEYKKR